MRLKLPANINADGLLPFLSLLASVGDETEIEMDFAGLRRVSPGGLLALVATTTRWLRQHRKVIFSNLDRCAITGYLQRMDVFRACGVDLPEAFVRHDSRGRFVPVSLIDHGVDAMGSELAACLAPGGEEFGNPHAALYDLAWYVFTEVANNARQHSRGLGYAAAQAARTEGLVRLAIADHGRGIRQSFIDAGLSWAAELDDGTAILRALEPKVSSRGRPTNEGVGLTLVSGLVRQTQGWLLVVSGSGVVTIKQGGAPAVQTLPDSGYFQGTLVVTAFRRDHVNDFAALLHEAKIQAGLLRKGGSSGRFQE